MNIGIIGCGYVGLVTGVCLSKYHNVFFYDIDKTKLKNISDCNFHIKEEGLTNLFNKNSSKIYCVPDLQSLINTSEVIFICVGTPSKKNGNVDLQYVFSVAKEIGTHLKTDNKIIVVKSTVPVGTCSVVEEIIESKTKCKFSVIMNPEFLKEGTAVNDTLYPEKTVIGGYNQNALLTVKDIFEPITKNENVFLTTTENAEIIKYACNCFLAMKISYINLISQLCKKVLGANINTVSNIIGKDSRIGEKFLQAGIGFGGSCFSKDINAFIHTLKNKYIKSTLIEEILNINEFQLENFKNNIKKYYKNFKKLSFLVAGITFKEYTNDLRESRGLNIANFLVKCGAKVTIVDVNLKASEIKNINNKFINDNVLADYYDGIVIVNKDSYESLPKLGKNLKTAIIFDCKNIVKNVENTRIVSA